MNPSQLDVRVSELRAKGMTYQEIADELGVSKKTVRYWVNPEERRRRLEEANRRRARGEPSRTAQRRAAIAQRAAERRAKQERDRAERERRRAEKQTNTRIAKRLRMTQKGAQVRGLECDLTKGEVDVLLFAGVCQQTGIPFEPAGNFAASIDRIDNTRGYTAGNVQAVCWIYNRAKGAGSEADVLRMARGLVARNPEIEWD